MLRDWTFIDFFLNKIIFFAISFKTVSSNFSVQIINCSAPAYSPDTIWNSIFSFKTKSTKKSIKTFVSLYHDHLKSNIVMTTPRTVSMICDLFFLLSNQTYYLLLSIPDNCDNNMILIIAVVLKMKDVRANGNEEVDILIWVFFCLYWLWNFEECIIFFCKTWPFHS